MALFGILNVTGDSFSDGGRFLDSEAAITQGLALLADGADVIDIGAASSNPDAAPVPSDVEIARLAAVIPSLKAENAAISIDSFAIDVQRWALAQGVDYLNDIHGFSDPALYPELAAADCKLVMMHMVQAKGVARKTDVPPAEIFARVTAFFDARIAALTATGIARDRLILDPGMGQFLGTDPENSLILLRRIPDLKKRYGLPVLISVSRKGFLRRLTGQAIDRIGPATLAAELFAEANGADYIRTHDPAALRGGLKILKSIGKDRH